MDTKVSYVVQEAIIVTRDVFRRYPGRYEGIIPKLCENLDLLDEPESKAAMVWVLGQFADKIDNVDELLDDLLFRFLEESVEVRSTLEMTVPWADEMLGATRSTHSSCQIIRIQAYIRNSEGTSTQGFKMDHRRN